MYVTLWPTRPLTPVRRCDLSRSAMSPSRSTWVNWAVCARNWVESAGLLGSWYLSWATSSLRKVSLSPRSLDLSLPPATGDVGPDVPLIPEVPEVGEVMTSLLRSVCLLDLSLDRP